MRPGDLITVTAGPFEGATGFLLQIIPAAKWGDEAAVARLNDGIGDQPLGPRTYEYRIDPQYLEELRGDRAYPPGNGPYRGPG